MPWAVSPLASLSTDFVWLDTCAAAIAEVPAESLVMIRNNRLQSNIKNVLLRSLYISFDEQRQIAACTENLLTIMSIIAEIKEFKALMRREYTLVCRTLFIYVSSLFLLSWTVSLSMSVKQAL